MLELEADHRRHAEIENAIRDLKYGVGLNHLPSGRFAANAAWLAVQVIAHNLARWTARLGLGEGIVTTRTLRRRYFALAGRLTRSARRWTLHLPKRWPWAGQWAAALARLRAIPLPRLTPAHSAGPGPRLAPACPRTPRAPSRRRSAPPSGAERGLLAPLRPRRRLANASTPAELSASPASCPVKLRSVDSGLSEVLRGHLDLQDLPAATLRDGVERAWTARDAGREVRRAGQRAVQPERERGRRDAQPQLGGAGARFG